MNAPCPKPLRDTPRECCIPLAPDECPIPADRDGLLVVVVFCVLTLVTLLAGIVTLVTLLAWRPDLGDRLFAGCPDLGDLACWYRDLGDLACWVS